MCRACGETLECPRCDIALTLHKHGTSVYLSCHYCDYQVDMPAVCPHCQEAAMRPFGVGTQQVEQAIHSQWPAWQTLRMDVDTTRKKGAHQRILSAFAAGEAQILIGTQMIAKGLDFPNVALVGVIAADTMLSVPDYRSAERTFQLLTQVAGRAGRAAISGRTVVQTYRPTHYSILAAANHDTGSFYQEEKTLRQMFHYPPYCELTVFVAAHTEAHIAEGAAARFERELKRRLSADCAVILPASPTGVQRIEDKFRYQVVVKYEHWMDVQEAIAASFQLVYEKMHPLHGICTIDVSAGRIG
jgi:primosomal protein N' (replication factor Y) (superfamily II helicase)